MHVVNRLMLPALLAAAIGIVAHAADDAAIASGDKQLNQLYWQGQEDLKKSDWNSALKHFGDLEQQLRAKEPKSADTALYWKAYTLVQAKRTSEAKAAVERLHRDFPDSRWSSDADTLLRQTQPAVQRSTQIAVQRSATERLKFPTPALLVASRLPEPRIPPWSPSADRSLHSTWSANGRHSGSTTSAKP